METVNNNKSPAPSTVIETARRVLRIESDALSALIDKVGANFEKAVDIILHCKGRVIVSGIGKSGIVATKIAATLTSTGTAALFLHPTEGMHGDLGLVLKDDVVICVSKSGNTGELTRLFPVFRRIGVPIITLTGNLRSALAERSDVVIDVGVSTEACPNNLAPTASTTAALAMGDALAVALLEKRNFKPEDFAFLHPGGSLGKKFVNIDDVMFTGDNVPKVHMSVKLREVILEITRKRFGGACIVDSDGRLVGIITDGDLRRLMQNPFDFDGLCACDIMNPHPHVVMEGSPASKALELLENFNIMQLIVVNTDQKPVGMVHLHDLLEAGIEIQ